MKTSVIAPIRDVKKSSSALLNTLSASTLHKLRWILVGKLNSLGPVIGVSDVA